MPREAPREHPKYNLPAVSVQAGTLSLTVRAAVGVVTLLAYQVRLCGPSSFEVDGQQHCVNVTAKYCFWVAAAAQGMLARIHGGIQQCQVQRILVVQLPCRLLDWPS